MRLKASSLLTAIALLTLIIIATTPQLLQFAHWQAEYRTELRLQQAELRCAYAAWLAKHQ